MDFPLLLLAIAASSFTGAFLAARLVTSLINR